MNIKTLPFFKKHNIKNINDYPAIGAFIVFNNLKDKVDVY